MHAMPQCMCSTSLRFPYLMYGRPNEFCMFLRDGHWRGARRRVQNEEIMRLVHQQAGEGVAPQDIAQGLVRGSRVHGPCAWL